MEGILGPLAGIIPPDLVTIMVFFAASSGAFYFLWNTFGLPLRNAIHQALFVTITIREGEILFYEFGHWLSLNYDSMRFMKSLKGERAQGEEEKMMLLPGYGTFIMLRKISPIAVITRSKEDLDNRVLDVFSIRAYFIGRERVKGFLNEVYSSLKFRSDIVTRSYGNGWYNDGQDRRYVPEVFSNVALEVKKDLGKFLSPEVRDAYLERNVPYRRGYLLSGIPGSGKSNLIAHLSLAFDLPIYYIGGMEQGFQAHALIGALPSNRVALLILEDADLSLFSGNRDIPISASEPPREDREERAEAEKSKKASMLRNLLNSLDGLYRSENFVFICTTNNLDALDKALLRPGRVDQVYTFGTMTAEEQFNYVNYHYRTDHKVSPVKERTVAELANIVTSNIHSVEDCLRELGVKSETTTLTSPAPRLRLKSHEEGENVRL